MMLSLPSPLPFRLFRLSFHFLYFFKQQWGLHLKKTTKQKPPGFGRVKNLCVFLVAFSVITAGRAQSLSLLPQNLMSGSILLHIFSLCRDIPVLFTMQYLHAQPKVRLGISLLEIFNFCFKNFRPKCINFLQLKWGSLNVC